MLTEISRHTPTMPCVPTDPAAVENWCAHLPGDDVIPTVNRAEAVKIADRVNDTLRRLERTEFDACPTAHACAWPWDTGSWQDGVVDFAGWLHQETE